MMKSVLWSLQTSDNSWNTWLLVKEAALHAYRHKENVKRETNRQKSVLNKRIKSEQKMKKI